MGVSRSILTQLDNTHDIGGIQMGKLLPDDGGVHLHIIRRITTQDDIGKRTKYTTSLYYYTDINDSYNQDVPLLRANKFTYRLGYKHPCLFVYKKEIQDRFNRYGCIFTCRLN